MSKILLTVCALLLSACDGGIFGTGGSDTTEFPVEQISAAPDSFPTDGAGSIDMTSNADTDSVGDTSEGAGLGTVGDNSADAGSVTGGDGGADAGAADAGSVASPPGIPVDMTPTGMVAGNPPVVIDSFINTVPVPDRLTAGLSLLNATTRTLNAFETSVEPETLLFAPAGVAPQMPSNTVDITNNNTSISIVDATNVARSLVSYTEFNVEPSTLTSIVVREFEDQISVVSLITETSTSDPMLTRVRVVQAGALDNASATANVLLLSAGDNPGGMESTLGPISFSDAQTDYMEISAGQYSISDELNRFESTLLSLDGGNVYTIILTGNGNNAVLLLNDTLQSQP